MPAEVKKVPLINIEDDCSDASLDSDIFDELEIELMGTPPKLALAPAALLVHAPPKCSVPVVKRRLKGKTHVPEAPLPAAEAGPISPEYKKLHASLN